MAWNTGLLYHMLTDSEQLIVRGIHRALKRRTQIGIYCKLFPPAPREDRLSDNERSNEILGWFLEDAAWIAGMHAIHDEPPPPQKPCLAEPSTWAKVDVMRRRVARGESCFHPLDMRMDEFDDSGRGVEVRDNGRYNRAGDALALTGDQDAKELPEGLAERIQDNPRDALADLSPAQRARVLNDAHEIPDFISGDTLEVRPRRLQPRVHAELPALARAEFDRTVRDEAKKAGGD